VCSFYHTPPPSCLIERRQGAPYFISEMEGQSRSSALERMCLIFAQDSLKIRAARCADGVDETMLATFEPRRFFTTARTFGGV